MYRYDEQTKRYIQTHCRDTPTNKVRFEVYGTQKFHWFCYMGDTLLEEGRCTNRFILRITILRVRFYYK